MDFSSSDHRPPGTEDFEDCQGTALNRQNLRFVTAAINVYPPPPPSEGLMDTHHSVTAMHAIIAVNTIAKL